MGNLIEQAEATIQGMQKRIEELYAEKAQVWEERCFYKKRYEDLCTKLQAMTERWAREVGKE